MLPFQLLHRDIKYEEAPSKNIGILKNNLLDTATFSYPKIYSYKIKSNVSSSEGKALKKTTKQKVILQNVDRGNTIVIWDKKSYIEKVKKLLSDTSKFEGFEIPPDKHLNFVINCWDKIKNILEALYHEESLTDNVI